MNHIVLARKWRPKRFADLIGQNNTVTILKNIISSGRLHHAYLLTGTRGVGKTTIARIIAKALNCLNLADSEPCCQCTNCVQIDSGRMVDVIEIDAASNTGVDNIREVLENAKYAPTSGKYKVYIIDEVHMLSKSAFNAMLKTLEEPPAHIVFILATTDPQKVPITVLSRCLQLKLRNLVAPEIQAHLQTILHAEQIDYMVTALDLIANAANGSMRDALSLTDQAIAFANGTISAEIVQNMLGISDDSSILEILFTIASSNSPQLVKICQQLNHEGRNLENILEQINYTLFQISLAQLSPQPQLSDEIQQLAQQISLQDCQLYFEISNLGMEQIVKVSQQYPIFVMTLLRMIAFKIGSHEEKQLIVAANNTHTTISLTQQDIPVEMTVIDTASNESLPDENNDQLPADNLLQLSLSEQEAPPTQQSDTSTEATQLIVATAAVIPPWEEQANSPSLEVEVANIQSIDNHLTSIANEESPLEKVLLQEDETRPIEVAATPISTPMLENFTGDWTAFVRKIDLAALDANAGVVLRNSQLEKFAFPQIELAINLAFKDAVTHECVDLLEKLLWDNYQQHFDLSFNFTEETLANSVKSQDTQAANLRQQDAEQAILNDPLIQNLINNFSAKILQIKPV